MGKYIVKGSDTALETLGNLERSFDHPSSLDKNRKNKLFGYFLFF